MLNPNEKEAIRTILEGRYSAEESLRIAQSDEYARQLIQEFVPGMIVARKKIVNQMHMLNQALEGK